MSRHALVIGEPYPDRRPTELADEAAASIGSVVCVVGWDPPLDTFFAQASVRQPDDDLRDLPPLLWVGGAFQDLRSAEALQEAVAGWVVLPEALLERLREEQTTRPPRLGRPAAEFYAWLAGRQEP
jgi:hypothetical protein